MKTIAHINEIVDINKLRKLIIIYKCVMIYASNSNIKILIFLENLFMFTHSQSSWKCQTPIFTFSKCPKVNISQSGNESWLLAGEMNISGNSGGIQSMSGGVLVPQYTIQKKERYNDEDNRQSE